MRTKHNLKIFLGLVVLLMVVLACGPTPTEQPAATPEAPTPAPAVDTPPTGNGETLTQEQKSYLAHATVRIWGVQKQGSKYQPIYNGSGTIISPDGLILTNCHVANPTSMGFPAELNPDALIVDLIKTEDKPPVSTYLAEVVAFDPTLDLAVIRIAKTLKGATVKTESLKLPFVPLGNSDEVKFGERIFVFGYPTIGGQTITYSTGDVAGFDAGDPVGERAWIKTEAAISGGNSGGLAANSSAEIIGVPTQMGTGTAAKTVDCRVLQDTNGDGVLDEKDTCIPAGGFINGVRPVNWALPLIEAAKNGDQYVSPYGDPLANETPVQPDTPKDQPSGSPRLTFTTWAETQDDNHCPVNELQVYPSGASEIHAFFSFSGFTEGETLGYSWFLNGKDVADSEEQWTGGGEGDCFAFSLANGGEALPDGDYVVKVFTGQPAKMIGQAQTSIGGDAPANDNGNTGAEVTLSGQVTDANSGKGLKGIYVVVLKPGVDPKAWIQDPQESEVYSAAQTGSDGSYQIADPLQRGKNYGVVAGNNGLGYPSVTGVLKIKADTPDAIELPIELSKQ